MPLNHTDCFFQIKVKQNFPRMKYVGTNFGIFETRNKKLSKNFKMTYKSSKNKTAFK